MINYVTGETLYYLNFRPCRVIINTDDNLATVMTEGYLDGENTVVYTEDLQALVLTTDGVVTLAISLANSHTSLIAPVVVP